MQESAGLATATATDPFNYRMGSRADLMSLSTINQTKDNMKTTTMKFESRRQVSQNLNTRDIDGKL